MASAGLVEWQQHQAKPSLRPEQETLAANTALVLPALCQRQDTGAVSRVKNGVQTFSYLYMA